MRLIAVNPGFGTQIEGVRFEAEPVQVLAEELEGGTLVVRARVSAMMSAPIEGTQVGMVLEVPGDADTEECLSVNYGLGYQHDVRNEPWHLMEGDAPTVLVRFAPDGDGFRATQIVWPADTKRQKNAGVRNVKPANQSDELAA